MQASFINMGSIILNYMSIMSQIKIALFIANGMYLKHQESTIVVKIPVLWTLNIHIWWVAWYIKVS